MDLAECVVFAAITRLPEHLLGGLKQTLDCLDLKIEGNKIKSKCYIECPRQR